MASSYSILLVSQLLLLQCFSLPQVSVPPVSSSASAAPPASTSITATCIESRSPKDPVGSAISAALTSASAVSNACGGDQRQMFTEGFRSGFYFEVDEMFLNVTHPTTISEPIEVSTDFCPSHFQAIVDQCISNGNFWGGWIDVYSANYSVTNFVYPANGLNAPPGGGGASGTGGASATGTAAAGSSTVVPPAGSSTVIPPAGSSTVVPPASGSSTIVPPAGSSTVVPPAGSSTVVPPAGSSTVVPPPGSSTVVPPAGSSTVVPPPGSSTVVPAPGSSTVVPPAGSSTVVPPPAGSSTVVPPPAGSSTVVPPPAGSSTIVPPAGSSTVVPPVPGSTVLPSGATVIVATISSKIVSETFVPTTNPQFVSLLTTLSTFSTNSLGSTVSYEIGPGGVEWQPLAPSGTGNPDLPPPTVLPPNSNQPQPPGAPTPTGTPAPSGPSAPPSTTAAPGSTTAAPGPGTTQPPSGGPSNTGPLSTITSYSSDFSSVATVVGITANTHISTSDGTHHGGIFPFVFGCWFCGGGGFVLWGMTLPGIYPPPINPPVPQWPTIRIGNDGNPTPDPSEEPTASAPTQTPTSHPTTTHQTTTQASSCVSSSIPSCTNVVSVSAGSSVTTSSCTTVFACSETATTGASTTTATGGPYCSPGSCGDSCAPTGAAKRSEPLPISGRVVDPEDYAKRSFARGSLWSRTQGDVAQRGSLSEVEKRGYIEEPADSDFNNNMDQFITEQIGYPGALPLFLPSDNPDSTARTIAFDSPPEADNFNYLPSVSGLEGCTSIVIVGEKGAWISHFWEQPWFLGYTGNANSGQQNFQQNVMNDLENGDGDNMPSPFAAGGQTARIPELANGDNGFKPEIHIVTLQENGAYAYDTEVGLMEQALTGSGRAFEGCTITRTGYARNQPDKRSANGKVLIQYTNEQETREFVPKYCPARAYYRVWVEKNQVAEHEWLATGNQVPGGAANKLKRADEPVCKIGQTYTVPPTGTVVPSATGTAANPSATNPSGSSGVVPPASGPSSAPQQPSTTVPPSTGTGPITTAPKASTTAKPPTCMHNPVDQDPPNCTDPPSSTGTITTAPNPSSTYKPPMCMHNPVDQDPPNCTNPPSSSQPFSCSAGSNLGLATYDPATWCGCNSPTGTLYPTLPSGSGDAACAYTAPPSQTVNPTIVHPPSTTAAAPSSTKAPLPSTTAVVLPTTTSERRPTEDTNCAGSDGDEHSDIFSCGGNSTLFQLFAPAGTPASTGKYKNDEGGWATYAGGGCYCINGNFCCASSAGVDTDLNFSFLQEINAPGGGNAVAFYQDLDGQCSCSG